MFQVHIDVSYGYRSVSVSRCLVMFPVACEEVIVSVSVFQLASEITVAGDCLFSRCLVMFPLAAYCLCVPGA